MQKVAKFIDNILEKRVSPVAWFFNFLGIVVVRLYLDKFIARARSPLFDLIMDLHNLIFFFLSFALLWLVLTLVLKKKPFDLSYLMLWVSLAIIFPPLFDLARTGGEVFWSFYLLSSPQDLFLEYLTFFGHLPSGIVYFGTRITALAGVFFLTLLVWVKTKKVSRSLLAFVGTYSGLFLMAAFPTLFFYLVTFLEKKSLLAIQPFQIIQFFSQTKIFGIELEDSIYALVHNLNLVYFLLVFILLSYFFWKSEAKMFLAVMRNLRYPQIFFHSGLLFFGFSVGFLAYPESFNLTLFSVLAFLVVWLSVFLAWEASVVVNDIFDYNVDSVSNPERPLQKNLFTVSGYAQFGTVLFFLSIIGGMLLHYKLGILLIVYQILAWFYSAAPYRLKRFPVIASFLSAATLLTVFFVGFIFFSPTQNLDHLPWRIVFLLLITYTLSLPIKDFKDIAGDKKDGVWTIPVIFGEEKGRLIVGAGIFISYVLSIFFINEMRLFWWAIIFGSLSFLVMNNKKIHPRSVFWWILPLVTLYGFVAVRIIFF
jgi:4-hydroxybenzoate polyprenyltransferase